MDTHCWRQHRKQHNEQHGTLPKILVQCVLWGGPCTKKYYAECTATYTSKCTYSNVITTSASAVIALVDDRKTPPAQVAGDDHHSVSFVFVLVND